MAATTKENLALIFVHPDILTQEELEYLERRYLVWDEMSLGNALDNARKYLYHLLGCYTKACVEDERRLSQYTPEKIFEMSDVLEWPPRLDAIIEKCIFLPRPNEFGPDQPIQTTDPSTAATTTPIIIDIDNLTPQQEKEFATSSTEQQLDTMISALVNEMGITEINKIIRQMPTPTVDKKGNPRKWEARFTRAFIVYPGKLDKMKYRNWMYDKGTKPDGCYVTWFTTGVDTRTYVFLRYLVRRNWSSPTAFNYEGIPPRDVRYFEATDEKNIAKYMTMADDECETLNLMAAMKGDPKETLLDRIVNCGSELEAAQLVGDNPSHAIMAMKIWNDTAPQRQQNLEEREQFKELTAQHPFQTMLEELVHIPYEPVGDRIIGYWYDIVGLLGKSFWVRYLVSKYPGQVASITCTGRVANLISLIVGKIEKGWGKNPDGSKCENMTLFIDLARAATIEAGLFEAIENLMNGQLDKTKYETIACNIKRGCKVVILTNTEPTEKILSCTSGDRLRCVDLWTRHTVEAGPKLWGRHKLVNWRYYQDCIKLITTTKLGQFYDKIQNLETQTRIKKIQTASTIEKKIANYVEVALVVTNPNSAIQAI